MVGTIESRKGHRQVLDAFELLWGSGVEADLIIVGRPGWLADDVISRIRRHTQLGRHLFWHDDLVDAELEDEYRRSNCLIAASEGEGFGLPLIEAAHAGLAILARDLAVFREVAGDHASYFTGTDAGELATAVREWIELYRRDAHPKSDGMPWITWQESTDRFVETVLGTREVQQFPPPGQSMA